MIDQIQLWMTTLAPIISGAFGILASIAIVLSKLKSMRNSVDNTIKKGMKSNEESIKLFSRQEAQITEINKKLTSLVESDKSRKKGD